MQILLTLIPGRPSTTGRPAEHFSGFDVEILDAPALTGSPKQVAWAETIRAASIKDFVVAGMERKQLPDGRWLKRETWLSPEVDAAVAQINAAVAPAAAKLAAYTAAKDWIEAADASKSYSTARALLVRK